jgi:hypothetical protein
LTTTSASTRNDSPPAEGMFRELLYIHAMLRRDLATVRRLADAARENGPVESIITEIESLQINSPLWRLKYGCMRYCRFVHGHHTLEDAALFPMVRKHDSSLDKVVDRLEEDHLTVHHITERIAAAADRIAVEGSEAGRAELVMELTELERHLLAHLDFEEESLGPLLSTWQSWPME